MGGNTLIRCECRKALPSVELVAELFDKNDKILRTVVKHLCPSCAAKLFNALVAGVGKE